MALMVITWQKYHCGRALRLEIEGRPPKYATPLALMQCIDRLEDVQVSQMDVQATGHGVLCLIVLLKPAARRCPERVSVVMNGLMGLLPVPYAYRLPSGRCTRQDLLDAMPSRRRLSWLN